MIEQICFEQIEPSITITITYWIFFFHNTYHHLQLSWLIVSCLLSFSSRKWSPMGVGSCVLLGHCYIPSLQNSA